MYINMHSHKNECQSPSQKSFTKKIAHDLRTLLIIIPEVGVLHSQGNQLMFILLVRYLQLVLCSEKRLLKKYTPFGKEKRGTTLVN